MCTPHVSNASDRIRRRLLSTLVRAQVVRSVWDSEERFDKLVESGRYLSLCSLFERTHEAAHRAWEEMIRSAVDSQVAKARPASIVRRNQRRVAA